MRKRAERELLRPHWLADGVQHILDFGRIRADLIEYTTILLLRGGRATVCGRATEAVA